MRLERDRPKITESNIGCAQPMPGENEMLEQLVADFSFTRFAIGRTVFWELLVSYNTKKIKAKSQSCR